MEVNLEMNEKLINEDHDYALTHVHSKDKKGLFSMFVVMLGFTFFSASMLTGGNLGTSGCVSYLFEKKGILVIEKQTCKFEEDDLMMLAIDNGAEDFETEEEVYQITTAPSDFTKVTEQLTEQGISFLEAGVQMIPSTYVTLEEKEAEKMQRLIDNLEELDDVIEVYHNWEE
ncbi:MAG: hypothetical protein HFJ14_10445 [Clostridium sp.]|uniref:YebC/PmpR family DNA-binding transcriptional regulator n=1 Tax=Clostridium sp. TaxID=1506 RepID=UPI0025C4A298|nr:YebC/PmpR family DNA-binding transcriptional regulator [Clostridium sp.]MCI9071060.1 hypothetical protein [Clostridium sp.]